MEYIEVGAFSLENTFTNYFQEQDRVRIIAEGNEARIRKDRDSDRSLKDGNTSALNPSVSRTG